jgi:hypothetical protein
MRLLATLLAALAVAVLAPARADALSCAGEDHAILGAEHAFIGNLVARDGALLTFHVRDVLRGALPEHLVVHDDLAPSWPMEVALGGEVGLVVRAVNGEFHANQCLLVDPDRLRLARKGGWPVGLVQDIGLRRATTRGTAVVLEIRCLGRCAGVVTLRARDGAVLARRRVALRKRSTTVALRLRHDARRRLERRGVLRARATVRLDTVEPLVKRPVTIVRQRNADGRSARTA